MEHVSASDDDVRIESFDDLKAKTRELNETGRGEEAVEQWQRFLAAHPRDAQAAQCLGSLLIGLDRCEPAIPWLKQALAIRPGMIAAKSDLGVALLKLNRFGEAASAFEGVLHLDPDNAGACARLGSCLRALNRHDEAARAFRKAFALRPADAAVAVDLAESLRSLKQPDEAIEVYRKVLRLDANRLDAASNLGSLLVDKRQFDEAASLIGKVVDHDPKDLGAWLNLGAAFLGGRRYAESVASFRRAIAIQPASVVAYCNIALALFSLGRLDEAVLASQSALTMEPGSAVASFNLGCIYLALGRMREGWEGYEFRFAIGGKKWPLDDAHAAPWMGEPLAGKSILVIGEQGNGDHIQFCRYVPLLVGLGAAVTYMAPARLHGLLGTLAGPITFIADLPRDARFDFQIPLMSVPRWAGRLGLPDPNARPYLAAEEARTARWRDKIGQHGFRIGVIWQGNIYPSGDFRRSFRLEALRPIALLPGVRLISLQMGEAVAQIGKLPPDMRVETLGEDFDTGEQAFLDSAAVMAGLDLVISCDTGLAHLAGALGRPFWLALPIDPEWRWQRHRHDTDWYPTARLFRQVAVDDYDRIFVEMAAELAPVLDKARGAQAARAPLLGGRPWVEMSWGEIFDRISMLEIDTENTADPEALVELRRDLERLTAIVDARCSSNDTVTQIRQQLKQVNAAIGAARDTLESCERSARFDDRFVEAARALTKLGAHRKTLRDHLTAAVLGSA